MFALIVEFTIGIIDLVGANWHQYILQLDLIGISLDLLNFFRFIQFLYLFQQIDLFARNIVLISLRNILKSREKLCFFFFKFLNIDKNMLEIQSYYLPQENLNSKMIPIHFYQKYNLFSV